MRQQPLNDLEHQRQHFDRITDQYYASRKNDLHLCLKDYIWSEALRDILPDSDCSDFTVLDAMCGYAESFNLILRHTKLKSFTFHAFDYSQKMVDLAQENYPDAKIWNQDITTFNEQQLYDLVFLIGGLHHVYNHAQQSLHNLSKALKPGGLLVSFEPTHNNLVLKHIRERVYKRNSFFDQSTERGFTTAELNRMFSKSYLKPIRQLFPGLLAYVLWYNPDAFPTLNRGTASMVNFYSSIEKKLWSTRLAHYLSFTTLSICKKLDSVL